MDAAVFRPEPGNGETAARLTAAGLTPIRCPLFSVVPVAATLPPGAFDAVLLTSANALRCGGSAISAVASMPVVAVGSATAAAARTAGLSLALTGEGDIADAVARAHDAGLRRLLHLAGRDHRAHPGIAATAIVYASEACAIDATRFARVAGGIALLHSSRAAERFVALLVEQAIPRAAIALAAISDAVARAAGDGWRTIAVAEVPSDTAMVALTARIAASLRD